MEDKELNELLDRYRVGKATPDDLAFLESWYLKFNQHPYTMDEAEREEDVGMAWAAIQTEKGLPIKTKLWSRIAVAASLTILFGIGLYFFNNYFNPKNGTTDQLISASQNNAAEKNTITLTLANGKSIMLSDRNTGIIVGKEKVHYDDGTNIDDPDMAKVMSSNRDNKMETINTSRGTNYQITLFDGTKVWLNAASSLTYLVGMNENGERQVKLQGEAYFEVAKDKKHAFVVELAGQTIRVLGTHFNVNSYANEGKIRTTLLEGSIKVNNTYLKPGQQSVLNGQNLVVTNVNTENVVAWKNNQFVFENDDILTVMRVLERWYDVEVIFQNGVPLEPLGGIISRSEHLSEVLKYLELVTSNKIHFEIKGRRVIVTK